MWLLPRKTTTTEAVHTGRQGPADPGGRGSRPRGVCGNKQATCVQGSEEGTLSGRSHDATIPEFRSISHVEKITLMCVWNHERLQVANRTRRKRNGARCTPFPI